MINEINKDDLKKNKYKLGLGYYSLPLLNSFVLETYDTYQMYAMLL